MSHHTIYKAAVLATAAALSGITLTACSHSNGSSTTSSSASSSMASSSSSAEKSTEATTAAAASDPRLVKSVCGTAKDKGDNQEIPIGEADHGPFHMEANYFQPAFMLNDGHGVMPAYKDSIAHIELDVKATDAATKYGYSKDETPADMNISYSIKTMDGKEVAAGKFIEMNAGDGSHYGTNIPKSAEAKGFKGSLDKPGKFKVTFHVAPPTDYALHADKRTGVKVHEWFKPFDVNMDMLYTAEQKKCIVSNPVENMPDMKAVMAAAENTAAVTTVKVPATKPGPNDPRLAKSICGTAKDKGDNQEIPIGEAEFGPLHMESSYFQPAATLSHGKLMPAYKDSIAHIELDVKANDKATAYGYSKDETPADLRISYTVMDQSGKTITKGKFVEMNAGDGSHYGTNIPKSAEAKGLKGTLAKPGNFTVVYHVAPPKAYGLHIDKRTGVKARSWFKPFDVSMPWIYTGEQLKCIVANPIASYK